MLRRRSNFETRGRLINILRQTRARNKNRRTNEQIDRQTNEQIDRRVNG